jgi:protein-ribulosamine 3-kinase
MDSKVQSLVRSESEDGRSKHTSAQGDFPIDQSVAAALPEGSEVMSAHSYGTSAWTATARIKVRLSDGSETKFFLKCATGDAGEVLLKGEYNSMSELYKWMPDFVPKPHAWGKCSIGEPTTYFFLQQFIDMSDRVPEPDQLCRQLAKLHRTSISPTGKFGFHVTTCQGFQPQMVAWENTWTKFFAKLLQHVADVDFNINGNWKELAALEQRVFDGVIPRLIGILEREGRTVRPCLIHGDLWEGNTGTSYEDGKIRVYDAAALYAHNEMEIGDWRCHYNKIHNKVYTRTYLRNFGPCEPKEEWDDRNRMYSIYFNVIYSCNHKESGKAVRQT